MAQPIIDLYHKDTDTFFIGAIVLVLLLLIIIIVLARKAEESDDRPKKKIRYDDIDWSMDGDEPKESKEQLQEVESSRRRNHTKAVAEPEPLPEPEPEQEPEPEDEPEETLPEEVKEELDAFAVPMWMTKHTISLDEANADAQKWIEEELDRRISVTRRLMSETERHAEQIEKLALEIPKERVVCIVTKDDGQETPDKGGSSEPEQEYPKVWEIEAEPAVQSKPESAPEPEIQTEPVPEPAPEPVVIETIKPEPVHEEPVVKSSDVDTKTFESGTLNKIIKEAEELKAQQGEEPEEESGPSTVEEILKAAGDREEGSPGRNIQETLRRLESMQTDNDSLAKDIGLYEEPAETVSAIKEQTAAPVETSRAGYLRPGTLAPENQELQDSLRMEYEQMLRGEEAVPSVGSNVVDTSDTVNVRPGRIRRFGLNNRDTNRSGRVFTEEELIKQIRD